MGSDFGNADIEGALATAIVEEGVTDWRGRTWTGWSPNWSELVRLAKGIYKDYKKVSGCVPSGNVAKDTYAIWKLMEGETAGDEE